MDGKLSYEALEIYYRELIESSKPALKLQELVKERLADLKKDGYEFPDGWTDCDDIGLYYEHLHFQSLVEESEK